MAGSDRPPPSRVERALLVVIVGGAAVVCFGIAVREAADDWAATRAADWPTAPGTILERRTFMAKPVGVRKESQYYRVLVKYRYAVGGREYEGERFNPYDGWTDKRVADDALARLPPGAPCDVAYDPVDPARAYLAPGPRTAAWVFSACMTVAGLLLIGIVVWVWRRVWKRRSAGGAG